MWFNIRMISGVFKKQIALPQDHGSWVFILSPLIIGLFAGGVFSAASLALVVAAMSAFIIRQPVTIAVKAYSGRRPRTDLPAARFWILVYSALILFSALALAWQGHSILLLLAIPAAPVFAWHLWLVSRREERRQAGIEILATGVLALAAPAAYWIGQGPQLLPGLFLWLLTWFQSAASIVYAYLRLEQREWKTAPAPADFFRAGWRALAYTAFNLVFSLLLAFYGRVPAYTWLACLIQFAEAAWGVTHPAIGAKPTAIGIRQLMVSILFTVVFILAWRF